MKLSSQVCTKEQSIKLRTLGIVQHSLFRHDNEGNIFSNGMDSSLITFQGSVAAFTLSELFEMLNPNCYSEWLAKAKTEFGYRFFHNKAFTEHLKSINVVAMADLLILYIETGKVTAEECNTRLMQA